MFLAIPTRIEDRRHWPCRPVANACLVVTNVLVFVLLQSPAWFLVPAGGWWTVMSYGFSHGSPWHLIGNMYVLIVVGNAVNRRIGNSYYLAAYLGTILAMGLAARLLGVVALGPFMGSSGAIFALVAILLMLMPAALVQYFYTALFPITLLMGMIQQPNNAVDWFIRWGRFQARAWWCFLLVPLIELWGLLWWRYSLGTWQWAHPAHLAGFGCGICVVLLLPTRITMGGEPNSA